ncbi:MAG: pirin family protein, partial [bacterium]|nr:pirin family protein [bacterium]
GIETVTYMITGVVNHKDSMENSGSIGGGDVQWMTSGGGIMHEEMPQPCQREMVGFQLWVNLPASLKLTTPRYQNIASEQIPEINREDGVKIRVIAGEVDGIHGPVSDIFANPTYLDVSIPADGSFSYSLERGNTVFAYVFEGQGVFGSDGQQKGETVTPPRLLVLSDTGFFEARATQPYVR